ncbi:glutamate--tRNA ligase [Candidatus Halobonum tyrrellensis]|uniref:Glutamate--tRNA ligase n=1 Tax=Candidatus Halobonum tyrrellensis G22 TaxID=1324957 RepID=V4HNJ2_9EURY|nr:glutamate--tRNA ligase [Candidatus Halobonum tyrrellensis]ESP89494.1 glutamyl-tRNA ligase [Candidatus Halobonum tyrrellensis G22]
MDDDLRERVRTAAERHALFNALKHGSDPDVGAIMGPLMGENPEFREHGDEIPGVVAPVASEVSGMGAEERRDRLGELAPDLLAELDADDEEEDDALPDLPNADEYDEIRMRLAPNPNGPWHLGNARMPSVIGTYKQQYDGWMLCRFDDTDPETKRPDLDAYDAILDAVDYLGFEPDEVVRASDRMETYYDHARELIDEGGAYTCSCPAEEFRSMKADAEACPHRDKPAETVREEFDAMVDGDYESGEMVLRVKTDIEHKNPALRDFVAFRMVDTPHPREEASDYRAWPMLDFQSGVDDHLTGITHIIRGIDLQDSAKRQRFVYDYFGWEYPEVLHWGHVQIDAYDVAMSTSTIKAEIADGELTGWDDPRAPTLASVRRRGIRGEAVVESMVELGVSTTNVDLAMSSVYANNRELVDDGADRRFLVRNGELLPVAGDDRPDAGHPPLHPNHDDRGDRDIPVDDAVRLEPDDVPADGERVWLKGYGCLRYEAASENADAADGDGGAGGELVWTGDDISAVREDGVPVVHWVPAEENVRVRLRTMDGDVFGRAEPGFASYEPDDVVQFERVGFARYDGTDDGVTVAYYAHP